MHYDPDMAQVWSLNKEALEKGLGKLECEMMYDKETRKDRWRRNLDSVCKYIDDKGKGPSMKDKTDPEVKRLGWWVMRQKWNYVSKSGIMQEEEIRRAWEEKVENEKYQKYLILDERDNKEKWREDLKKVLDYIDENGKDPSIYDETNPEAKRLGLWVQTQKQQYEKKTFLMKEENDDIRQEWKAVVESEDYKGHLDAVEKSKRLWREDLKKVLDYMIQNNKRPPVTGGIEKDENVKQQGIWISKQNQNYKNKKQIMKEENADIRDLWEQVWRLISTDPVNIEGLREFVLINNLETKTTRRSDEVQKGIPNGKTSKVTGKRKRDEKEDGSLEGDMTTAKDDMEIEGNTNNWSLMKYKI